MTVISKVTTQWTHFNKMTAEEATRVAKEQHVLVVPCDSCDACYRVDQEAAVNLVATHLQDWTIEGNNAKKTPRASLVGRHRQLNEAGRFLKVLEVMKLPCKRVEFEVFPYNIISKLPPPAKDICRITAFGWPAEAAPAEQPMSKNLGYEFEHKEEGLEFRSGCMHFLPPSDQGIPVSFDDGTPFAEILPQRVHFLFTIHYSDDYDHMSFFKKIVPELVEQAMNESNFKNFKKRLAAKQKERLVSFFSATLSKRVTSLRTDVTSHREAVREHLQLAAQKQRKVQQAQLDLESAQRNIKSKNFYRKEVSELLKIPEVKSIRIGIKCLEVETSLIKCDGVPLGEFLISIYASEVHLHNQTPIGEYHHPHIVAGRNVCWGNAGSLIVGLLGSRDYSKLVPFLIAFLQTYNKDEGGYGEKLAMFKERDANEKKKGK